MREDVLPRKRGFSMFHKRLCTILLLGLFGLLGLLYAACKPTLPDGRVLPEDDCKTDQECEVSNDPESGCCSNCRCPTEPFGIGRSRYQKEVDACATSGACYCGPEPKRCAPVSPVTAFVARCKGGICVAEHQ